jgi:hypothetical protein
MSERRAIAELLSSSRVSVEFEPLELFGLASTFARVDPRALKLSAEETFRFGQIKKRLLEEASKIGPNVRLLIEES